MNSLYLNNNVQYQRDDLGGMSLKTSVYTLTYLGACVYDISNIYYTLVFFNSKRALDVSMSTFTSTSLSTSTSPCSLVWGPMASSVYHYVHFHKKVLLYHNSLLKIFVLFQCWPSWTVNSNSSSRRFIKNGLHWKINWNNFVQSLLWPPRFK